MPHGRHDPNEKPEDLNQLIDVFLLADAANLKQTKERAVEYFEEVLNSAQKIIFSENQIEKLAPLIAKENLLEGSSFTNDEILQPLFPKLFVSRAINLKTKHMLLIGALRGLRLSGTNFKYDGEFTILTNGDVTLDLIFSLNNGVNYYTRIAKLHDDWVIYLKTRSIGAVEKVLWKNPLSKNMPLPPKSGWVPVDEFAIGEPIIEYLYSKN
jgi:hypothetical protein